MTALNQTPGLSKLAKIIGPSNTKPTIPTANESARTGRLVAKDFNGSIVVTMT